MRLFFVLIFWFKERLSLCVGDNGSIYRKKMRRSCFLFFDFVFWALQLHIWNCIITFPTSAVNHLEIKSLNATTVRRFYFGTPVFTLFLYEILIKFDTQWQFQNLLVMTILKHPLHYMLNLMKFWLRYLRLKTVSCYFSKINIVFIFFNVNHLSQFFIKFKDQGQISRHEDSITVIDC